MNFDAASYIMGAQAGRGAVEIDGNVVCTDDGNGNITITNEEEAVTDG